MKEDDENKNQERSNCAKSKRRGEEPKQGLTEVICLQIRALSAERSKSIRYPARNEALVRRSMVSTLSRVDRS